MRVTFNTEWVSEDSDGKANTALQCQKLNDESVWTGVCI